MTVTDEQIPGPVRVNLTFNERAVRVPYGVTLFDAASWNGIAIDSTCGGHGTCKKCRIRIAVDPPAPSSLDIRAYTPAELNDGWRLACRTPATRDTAVEVPPLTTRPKAATVGVGRQVILRPAVQKRYLELAEPSLADQATDLERVLAQLDDLEPRAELAMLRTLGQTLRAADYKVTAVVVDDLLIAVEPGDTTGRRFGIAFDLGTTTVVATLLDLSTGTPVAVESTLNSQQPFGADVITRISATMMDPGALAKLQNLAHETLAELAQAVCAAAGVAPDEVYEVALAGNATMTHIVLGIDPEPLGMAPFIMSTRLLPEVLAADLGLGGAVHPRARAVVFPAFGAYVGGDITAGLLASGMDRDARVRLFVDIGTNCEIVLAVSLTGKILVAGEFTSFNAQTRQYIARLNTDGSVDPTFDPGVNGPNNPIYAMAFAPNGSTNVPIMIGGAFTSIGGQLRGGIARLNLDGTLDTSFAPLLGANGVVRAVAVQPSGSVLLGGEFTRLDNIVFNRLGRLGSNGHVDTTFQPGTGADDTVFNITLQTDGTIYVGGLFTSFNGTHRLGFARLLANGLVDTSFLDTAYNQFAGLPKPYFNPNVNPKNFVLTSAVESGGKVLIGGSFAEVGGLRIAFNQSGSPAVQTNLLASWMENEQFTRSAIRSRANVARLLNNPTPGPGNLGFVQSAFNVNENGGYTFVQVARNNGTLARMGANFSVPERTSGVGKAQAGVDYTFSNVGPLYETTHGDGLGPAMGPSPGTASAANGLTLPAATATRFGGRTMPTLMWWASSGSPLPRMM